MTGENTTVNWLPLSFESLSFGYQERPLFYGFHLNLQREGFYLLQGAEHSNSCIYLLRFLVGLSRPREGVIRSSDICVSNMSFEEYLPWLKSIGYAFESGGLLSNKTCRDNLLLQLQYHQLCSPSEAGSRVDHMLKQYGLFEVQNDRPADLSRSDYKMTLLCRSLLHDPTVLLLDEPEEGLESPRFVRFAEEVQRRYQTGHLKIVLYTSKSSFQFSRDHQWKVRLHTGHGDVLSLDEGRVA